jgi:hypothetical protein
MQLTRCISCDGYGWVSDIDEGTQDCDWCHGVGYAYRDDNGVQHPIPTAQLAELADALEMLEIARLRELGYSGQAKRPWEQAIRQQRGSLLNGE